MKTLTSGCFYILQDYDGARYCRAKMFAFLPDNTGEVAAVFDLSQDRARDASWWGDFVYAVTGARESGEEIISLYDISKWNMPVFIYGIDSLPAKNLSELPLPCKALGKCSILRKTEAE